jgi:hypothetical protein
MTDPNPVEKNSAMDVTMNDNLPSGNPSLKSVLLTLGAVGVGTLVFIFRAELGF